MTDPVAAYLDSVSAGSRRPTLHRLRAATRLLTDGQRSDGDDYPWENLTPTDAEKLVARVREKYAPRGAYSLLSTVRQVLRLSVGDDSPALEALYAKKRRSWLREGFRVVGNDMVCPAGKTSIHTGRRIDNVVFRFSETDCRACPRKKTCTPYERSRRVWVHLRNLPEE